MSGPLGTELLDCCRCNAGIRLTWSQLASFESASKVLLCCACEDDDHAPATRSQDAIYPRYAAERARIIGNSPAAGAQQRRRLVAARQRADSALVEIGAEPTDPERQEGGNS